MSFLILKFQKAFILILSIGNKVTGKKKIEMIISWKLKISLLKLMEGEFI